MANFFDQFDEKPKANFFDQFDESPESKKMKEDFSSMGGHLKNAVGGVDAAVSMAAGVPAYIASGLSGLGKLMTSGSLEQAANTVGQVQESNFGMGAPKPFTQAGQQVSDMVGEGMAGVKDIAGEGGYAVGGELGRTNAEVAAETVMNFLPIPGYKGVQKLGKGVEKKFAREPQAPAPAPAKPNYFDQFDSILDEQYAKAPEVDAQQVAALEAALRRKPAIYGEGTIAVDSAGQGRVADGPYNMVPDRSKAANADAIMAQRQRELELAVARQTALDLGAANRRRQEAAPTGFDAWQDALRRDAETRRPGDNTPVPFESPYPASIVDHPAVLQDAPMRQEGLDYTQHQANIMARPFEQDMAARKAPEEAAWEGEGGGQAITSHNPVPGAKSAAWWANKQRGAINPQLVKDTIALYNQAKATGRDVIAAFRGTFHPDEMEFMQRAIDNPGNRNSVVLMSPDEFHYFAANRSKDYLDNTSRSFGPENRRMPIREGLKSPDGLKDIPTLFTRTKDGVAQVNGHEGRHRMDVFKEMGIEKVPVMIRDASLGWDQHAKHLLSEDNYGFPDAIKPFPERLNNSAKKGFHPEYRGPASQRGAIDLRMLLGDGPTSPLPDARAMDSTHPLVVAAGKQLEQQKKEGILAKVLGNPYVDSITSPEQVLAAFAQGAKDIGAVAAARMKTVGSGINSAVLSSNNPLLKYARTALRDAEKTADILATEHITNEHTGLAPKWNKLSMDEKNAVMAHLLEQDKLAKQLPTDKFNPKQVEVINKVNEMEALKLSIWNKKLAEAGLPPVKAREGHFPGVFTGDYRTLVLDAKDNAIGFVGTGTKRGHAKVIEQLKKDYPGAKFVDMGRKQLAGIGERGYSNAMSELAKVLIENDPAFKDLSQKANKLVGENADKMYAAHLHAMDKKGIFGSEGRKPWEDRDTNTKEAMKAYINYWDTGMRSHLNIPVETQLKGLIANPSLDMPNAKAYMEKYMLHATGRSVADFGRAVDTLLDTPGALLGYGPSYVRGVANQTTKRVGQQLMGFGNLAHMAVQFLQVPAMAVPQFVNIAKQFGVDPMQIGVAQARGIQRVGTWYSEILGNRKVAVDEYTRAMFNTAEQMGFNKFSEFQEIAKTSQSKAGRIIDDAIDLNRQLPEASTRPFAFFTLAELMRDVPGLTPEQKLSAAYNATQEAMVDYTPREKPMFYGDMGQVGKLTGSLSTFKHAAFSQAGRLAKEAAKGNVAPAGTMAAIMYALAGVKGIYGYDDADAMVKTITEMLGKRQTIRELLLDPNITSEVVKSGALSAWTGLDLQGRVAVNGFIPETPWEAIAGPFGSKLWKIGDRAAQASKNIVGKGNGPLDFKNLALELMPGGHIKMHAREKLMNDPDTNRLTGPDGLPGNDRTKEDIDANLKYGVTSLKQAHLSEQMYNDSQRLRNDREAQKNILSQAQKYHSQGMDTDPLLEKFLARGGDPKDWPKAFVREEMGQGMSKLQRQQGIQKQNDLDSIYRYQHYQRSRDVANKP